MAGALELMRRVLQPSSRSLPHLTVRHASKAPSTIWETGDGSGWHDVRVTLEAPITWSSGPAEELGSVVIACSSEELELDVYKPDFPQSLLHFTIYDGEPSHLAAKALDTLSRFRWGLELRGPLLRFPSSRVAAQASSLTLHHGIALTDAAADIQRQAWSAVGLDEATAIKDMADTDRLGLLQWSAAYLHRLPALRRVPAPRTRVTPEARSKRSRQLAFWTEAEVAKLAPAQIRQERIERRSRSAFATPPELARDVADAAAKYLHHDLGINLGDPAVGNGVLIAAARRAVGADRVSSAHGIDVDEETAERTRRRWTRADFEVETADFLRRDPRAGAWHFVIANPPYRRSQKSAHGLKDVRASLQEALSLNISARSDMYVYFVLRAHAWMARKAVAAWIIPSEFQVTTYGGALRAYLSTRVRIERIHTYDSRDLLFDKALASTSVVIFTNRAPHPDDSVRISAGGTLAVPSHETLVTQRDLSVSSKWNFEALTSGGPAADQLSIADLFTCRRGIATGANAYFVLEDEARMALGAGLEWLRAVVPAARSIPDAHLRADERGLPLHMPRRWLIDTDAPLSLIGAQSESFAEYLSKVAEAVSGLPLAGRRRPVYKQESRAPAPFLFVYMAKADGYGPRFVRNDTSAVALNNYIGLYPVPAVDSWLGRDRKNVELMHRWLNEIPTGELRTHGRMYGKGLLKLEPSDLAQVHLPVGASRHLRHPLGS